MNQKIFVFMSFNTSIQIGERNAVYLYIALALGYVQLSLLSLTQYSPHLPYKPGIHRLVRPISHRRRACRILRRSLPWTCIPARHEPCRENSASLPTDRFNWLDCWCRSGRVCLCSVHHGCYRLEGRHRVFAACVSG